MGTPTPKGTTMKINRPVVTIHNKNPAASSLHWYDLGYEDAVLDAKEKQSAHHEYYMNLYDVGSTRTSTDYDKGWMEARDDMESVMEIVHFCLKQDRALYAQLIIEHYINCKENSDE
jgi:hypothetical protein